MSTFFITNLLTTPCRLACMYMIAESELLQDKKSSRCVYLITQVSAAEWTYNNVQKHAASTLVQIDLIVYTHEWVNRILNFPPSSWMKSIPELLPIEKVSFFLCRIFNATIGRFLSPLVHKHAGTDSVNTKERILNVLRQQAQKRWRTKVVKNIYHTTQTCRLFYINCLLESKSLEKSKESTQFRV